MGQMKCVFSTFISGIAPLSLKTGSVRQNKRAPNEGASFTLLPYTFHT